MNRSYALLFLPYALGPAPYAWFLLCRPNDLLTAQRSDGEA